MAFTNRDRIIEVLITLIDNAIKHSEADKVIIRVEENKNKYIVSVENKGYIAPEDMPHLFERFYKADKSHSDTGAGLGLSIASEIMTLLNESMHVKCENGIVAFAFTLEKSI